MEKENPSSTTSKLADALKISRQNAENKSTEINAKGKLSEEISTEKTRWKIV